MASPDGPRKFTSIDDYHAAQSDEVRSRLDQIVRYRVQEDKALQKQATAKKSRQ